MLRRSAAAASFPICESSSVGVTCSDELLPGLELDDGGHEGVSKGE